MPSYCIRRELIVPVPTERVRAQIQDIERYPDYLPGCCGAGVLQRHDDGVTAWLDIEGLGRRTRLVTRNYHSEEGVQMQLQEGPLKELEGSWKLTPMSESGVRVSLRLNLRTAWMPIPGGLLEAEADKLVQAMYAQAVKK